MTDFQSKQLDNDRSGYRTHDLKHCSTLTIPLLKKIKSYQQVFTLYVVGVTNVAMDALTWHTAFTCSKYAIIDNATSPPFDNPNTPTRAGSIRSCCCKNSIASSKYSIRTGALSYVLLDIPLKINKKWMPEEVYQCKQNIVTRSCPFYVYVFCAFLVL